MSKKPTARGKREAIDPSTLPGVKRASEIELTPQQQAAIEAKRIIELRSATAPPDPKEFTMTAADAAAKLNITSRTLIRYAEDGELPFVRGIKRTSPYMFRPADVDAFAARAVRYSPGVTLAAVPPADGATNPAVEEAMRSSPAVFRGWSQADLDELCSLHGSGGPLTTEGVLVAAEHINRKRAIRNKFEAIMEADEQHFRTLSTVIEAIYKEVTIRPKRRSTQD